jgi:hypothetical protein
VSKARSPAWRPRARTPRHTAPLFLE